MEYDKDTDHIKYSYRLIKVKLIKNNLILNQNIIK